MSRQQIPYYLNDYRKKQLALLYAVIALLEKDSKNNVTIAYVLEKAVDIALKDIIKMYKNYILENVDFITKTAKSHFPDVDISEEEVKKFVESL